MIVDKAGNESAKKTISYYYKDDSKVSDYKPEDVTVGNSYGKNIIRWKEKELPNSVSYALYRGKTTDFTPSKENLIRDSIKDPYCMDPEIFDGTERYYKICAQKISEKGEINSQSDFVTIEASKGVGAEEYTKRLGSKDYRDGVQIETPTGSGTIEKSGGNLTYENTDFDIQTAAMGLSLQRSYRGCGRIPCRN